MNDKDLLFKIERWVKNKRYNYVLLDRVGTGEDILRNLEQMIVKWRYEFDTQPDDSTDLRIDLILEHLGLEVVKEPASLRLKQKVQAQKKKHDD